MKIGIIAHIQHPIRKPFAGGLEAFTYNIAKLLRLRGHEVVLFASSLSDASLGLHPILDDGNYDQQTGVRNKKTSLSSVYIDEHHAYMELMLSIDRFQLDIIFNNSLHYVPITMADTVHIPMLTVFHTPPFFEIQKAVEMERTRGRIQYVTVSHSNKRSWQHILSDCEVIPNGIDLSQWDYYPHAVGNYAIWYGRIHPDKGLEHAILASKKINMPLKVVGKVCDSRYLDRTIRPILHPGVELLGHKTHREINHLLGGAKVCLITPNWEEPFGLVIAESLAAGTPIAGFKKGALSELINDECGILINHGDTDALADAIVRAGNLSRLSCRQWAEKCFDMEGMADAYLEKMNAMISQLA